jgi:hypothetical protein
MLGVAAARILESVQANGFTPQEIEKRQLMPFWRVGAVRTDYVFWQKKRNQSMTDYACVGVL